MLQSDLDSALSFVSRVTTVGHELYSCLLLESNGESLRLSAYSPVAYATAAVPCDTSIEPTLFPASTLAKVVSGMSEDIELSFDGDLRVRGETGDIKIRPRQGIFPRPPDFSGDDSYTLFCEPFAGALSVVSSWRIRGGDTPWQYRPLAIYPIEGGAYAASLSEFGVGLWGHPEGDPVLLDPRAAATLRGLVTDADVLMSWDYRRVEFSCSGRTLSIPTSSQKLPDIKGIVDGLFRDVPKVGEVDLPGLRDAMRLIEPVADTTDYVEMMTDGDVLRLQTRSNLGDASAAIPIDRTGEPGEPIALGLSMLKKILVGLPNAEVALHFNAKRIGVSAPWERRALMGRSRK